MRLPNAIVKAVFSCLTHEPITANDIARQKKLDVSLVEHALLKLERNGRIIHIAVDCWMLKDGEPDTRIDYSEVEKLYYQGYNDTDIGRMLNIHNVTVFNWRKRNGLPCNTRRYLFDSKAVRELYECGFDDIEISKKLNLPRGAAFQWRQKNDLPANNPLGQRDYHKTKQMHINKPIPYDMPVEDKESLYCDNKFLTKFFDKDIEGGC